MLGGAQGGQSLVLLLAGAAAEGEHRGDAVCGAQVPGDAPGAGNPSPLHSGPVFMVAFSHNMETFLPVPC